MRMFLSNLLAGHRPRIALLCSALLVTGCSPMFWSNQADRDSYDAIAQNLDDPRWALPRIDISPAPHSRIAWPYPRDCGPLPPDDPAAHVYMHWVDGWDGYKGWHKYGTALSIENPHWVAGVGLDPAQTNSEDGTYMSNGPGIENLTLTQAVELSLIHSRDFQFELEEIYLAALAVTFERFQFGVRFLGFGGEPSLDYTYEAFPGRPGDNSQLRAQFGVSQLLPAGGQWTLDLLNNTVWIFDGRDSTNSATTLAFSLVQPLLLGAGRKVVLEALTQLERNLLYEVREFARFRKVFFTAVVSDFLSLLQQVQLIRNERENIVRLSRQVEQLLVLESQELGLYNEDLAAFPEDIEEVPVEIRGALLYSERLRTLTWMGPMDAEDIEILRNLSEDPAFNIAIEEIIQRQDTTAVTLDVLQLQSSLTNAIARLRDRERSLQDSLDAFKLQLGLPTDFPLSINNDLLAQFQFISEELTDLETAIILFPEAWADLNPTRPEPEKLARTVEQFQQLVADVRSEGVEQVRQDLVRFEESLPQQLEALEDPADQEQMRLDLARDKRLFDQVVESLRAEVDTAIENALEALEQAEELENLATWVGDPLFQAGVRQAAVNATEGAFSQLIEARTQLLIVAQGLSVIQVGARVDLVKVEPFEYGMEEAVAIGLQSRLDLMNARARVMDARRQIVVAENALRAVMDVVVEGEIGNADENRPFAFQARDSELRAGLRLTAPLDQIRERNAYRAAQIRYQRARRDYIEQEDLVKQQIRRAWRQLAVLRQNLQTSRRAVRIAALQYDNAVEEANNTTRQGGGSQGLSGQNLVRALNDILGAQNDVLGNWIDYEQNRLSIYRDMGIMEIDADGVWTDSFYQEIDGDDEFRNEQRQLPPADDEIDEGRDGDLAIGGPLLRRHPDQSRPGGEPDAGLERWTWLPGEPEPGPRNR